MSKILLVSTVFFLITTVCSAYQWLDLVVTRNYEVESAKVTDNAYMLSARLLENEFLGRSYKHVLDTLKKTSNDLRVDIIDKTESGNGVLWFGTVKFEFDEHSLKSIGKQR